MTIIDFNPKSGPPGTRVTIAVDSVTGLEDVLFNGLSYLSFIVREPSTIIATVPETATTGKITIVTASGEVQSSMDFTVTQPA